MEFFSIGEEKHGMVLQSVSELDVLGAGLRVLSELSGSHPGMPDQISGLRRTITDLAAGHENLVSNHETARFFPDTEALEVILNQPGHVAVAEIAVQIVASNPPREGGHPYLQDSLRQQFAMDMAVGYATQAAEQGTQIPGWQ